MHTAAIVTIVYGALVLLGGVMGYLKAKSRPSLVSGLVFGPALAILGVLGLEGWTPFAGIAAGLAAVLLLIMGSRFARKRKFMPAGLITVLSAAALAVDLWAVFGQ